VIRPGIFGAALDQRAFPREAYPQLFCNGLGDFILDREHVCPLSIIALSPKMVPISSSNSPCCNANPVSYLAHTPFEDIGLTQCLRNLPDPR
jgi:hypothetical protein